MSDALARWVLHPLPARGSEMTHQENTSSRGSFVADTRIWLAVGAEIEIKDLEPGPWCVRRPDGRVARVNRATAGFESSPVARLRTAGGKELTVSKYHPMVARRYGTAVLIPALELGLGDELPVVDEEGNVTFEELVSFETLWHEYPVYSVALEGGDTPSDHLLVANGIVTGDLHLQEEYRQLHEQTLYPARLAPELAVRNAA